MPEVRQDEPDGRFQSQSAIRPRLIARPVLVGPHVPIYIAAVNEQMLRLAGEVCDGVQIPPTIWKTGSRLREQLLKRGRTPINRFCFKSMLHPGAA